MIYRIWFIFLFIIFILGFIKTKDYISYDTSVISRITKTLVSIILPITSKRNKINKNNPDPSQLLLINYFYPSFLSTIEPFLYDYRIYIGYAKDDEYLSNNTFLKKLKEQMKNYSFSVY